MSFTINRLSSELTIAPYRGDLTSGGTNDTTFADWDGLRVDFDGIEGYYSLLPDQAGLLTDFDSLR